MKMKRLLLISILILSGCSSQTTVEQEASIDYETTIEELENIIKTLESENEELTLELETLKDDYQLLVSTNDENEILINILTSRVDEMENNSRTIDIPTEYPGNIFGDSDDESSNSGGDGIWDYNLGGTDRDADNDGFWDYDKGGTDRDMDNDGIWDYDKGGTDRDLN